MGNLLNGSGVAFRHTNLDRFPRSDIILGSVPMFRHKHWIGYHVPMVNTRFNGIRPVASVNAPAEESTAKGRDRGRGRE
uniref:'chromo' domain containing protein n=1 Tax=Solanum tuberosum TaxID=4113 RepID=M1DEW5_SOLTU